MARISSFASAALRLSRAATVAALAFACAASASAQTVNLQPKIGAPLAGLTAAEQSRFSAGRTQFSRVFSAAEGLGPIFNQNSCGTCHSQPLGGSGSIFVTRFGFSDAENGGFDPLDALGGSLLQANAISAACQESIPPQANVTTHRITTSALGLGLLEAIPDADILAWQNSPPGSVSGVAHMVQPLEDPMGPQRVGRFGWKAQVATVLTFSGDAALNEMGITNRLVGAENAPNGNMSLLMACDMVADPEDVADPQGVEFIDRVTDFQRFVAAPPQTPRSGMSGEAIFNAIGCADCHRPSFTTSNDPMLETSIRNKMIRPYSDFLLHDMGLNADFIAQGAATEFELRTPPLWGIRVRDPMWHDGRVSGGTFADRIAGPNGAIAQHDAFLSEAATSAQLFASLPSNDKMAVVAFLDSLGKREFDSNGDNVLDHDDLAAFLAAMTPSGVTADMASAVFDVDQDGDIDMTDLQNFAVVYEEDCNGNGIGDLADVLSGTSFDSNGNYIPDECEHCQADLGFQGPGAMTLSICGDMLTAPGSMATALITGVAPFGQVFVILSDVAAPTPIVGGGTLVPAFPFLSFVSGIFADSQGRVFGPISGGGPAYSLFLQSATISPMGQIQLSNALNLVGGM